MRRFRRWAAPTISVVIVLGYALSWQLAAVLSVLYALVWLGIGIARLARNRSRHREQPVVGLLRPRLVVMAGMLVMFAAATLGAAFVFETHPTPILRAR